MLSAFVGAVNGIGLYEVEQLPLTVAMVLLAIVLSRHPRNLLARLEALIRWIALKPYLSLTFIVVAAIGGPLAVRPLVGFPDPISGDEYSLMLQAKTYLAGRLANPSLTPNFATEWVILDPTYASQYPVLRSLPLLIGYAVGVGAWGGVVLSMAALASAVYWMVSVWIDARYAFVAAMLVILRFGLFSMWVNSYFGGAITALGGVLLVGSYAIVRSRPTVVAGGLLGLGVFLLMTTRPYEGLFYAAPLGGALAIHWLRSGAEARKSLLIPGAVAAALVVAGFSLTLADNLTTTGNWKVSPYTVFDRTYAIPPALMPAKWEWPRSSAIQYDWLRRRRDLFYARLYERRNSLQGVAGAEIFRFRNYWNFYVGFALSLPFVVGLWALRREPAVLLSAAALALALTMETYDFEYYAPPGFGFVVLAVMLGFQSLRVWKPGYGPVGLALSRTLPLALVLGTAIPLSSALSGKPQFPRFEGNSLNAPCCWIWPRSLHVAVENEIQRTADRNLIIVDTGPRAPLREILVANGPSVDDARSIWVNDDPEYNVATIARYRDRRIWRLGWLDDRSPCLQLFQGAPTQIGASLLGSFAKLPDDPERSWSYAQSGQCPEGLTRPPWSESTKR